ncbi:MAG: S8 family serine peptidase, partial [Chloroflexota bacterium]|nr:S8 family serine peptidase [Chloroflexota bacterium]
GSINEPQFPGAFPVVLAVAATDQADGHVAFSNVNGYVDVSAPGVRIWSTTPTYPTTLSRANPSTTVYAAFSGTSQAAPLVAGIAALLLSTQPSLTGQQLADRLRATADDQGAVGVDDVFGMGRVNALRAVTVNAPARYGATYDISALPKSATFAAPIAAPITIKNQSSFAWSPDGPNPVRLAYHWTDLAGTAVVWDGQRSPLPAEVPIGGSVIVNALIAPPKTAGSYVLRIDLVREGVAWFSAGGAPSANATIGVTSGLAAGYAPAAGSQSTLVLGSNAVPVTVSNTGTAVWPAAGTTPVHLSYHWIGSAGEIVVWDGARANLPTDLAPGQTAVVTMNVTSPAKTGSYTLRLDLVQEGVAWFSSQGVPTRDLLVNVTTGLGATYGLTAPATSFLPGSRALLPVTLTNMGLLTWRAGGATPVHAAAHVYDLLDRVLVWDGERTVLPSDVAPGQTVTLNVAVAVPPSSAAATYTFRVDLVQEGVAWFSSYGISPATGALSAVIDYRAAFSLASTTISRSTPAVTVTATNAGQAPWTSGGTAPLDLGSHWLAIDGSVLVWEGPRVPLAQQAVAPGASVTIVLPLASPPPGAVALVVDIVAEGLRWFGSGSPRPVTLVP